MLYIGFSFILVLILAVFFFLEIFVDEISKF